jgi:hypothetical protein
MTNVLWDEPDLLIPSIELKERRREPVVAPGASVQASISCEAGVAG